ncbi:hypothetical protein LW139_08440 [Proteus vulgaris]|uniref:hypothetical protein n=1 Tax=Proteus TaxID=583 RepID=UPI00141346A5|nr:MULTISPECIES: hypothetical protein [Proteus]NBM55091.1 hypothetical protein [Proteus sp. G2669]UDN37506.1 hypothetical protein LG402_07635 [Proteus sp. NMG38-2]UPK82705.1 hypothetical protein LW139_08440 [Proteus vulgaris]
METITGELLKPVIEEKLISHKKQVIKKADRQSFIIISSYFLITYLISFSLYATNSKHTLLLFFLQSTFFVVIPFLFRNTRVLLKESINYLIR